MPESSYTLRVAMRWIFAVALFLPFSTAQPPSDSSARDPEFDKVRFSEWFSGGPQTAMRWTERALPVLLSVHQRLLARVLIQLDGAEAAKRRGRGQIIFFIQLTDSRGRIYQDHTTYDLEKVEEGVKAQDLNVTESLFVQPGDYSVAIAIYHTATSEHSVRKDKLHIPPLKTDPLPDAGRDLPPVEFVEAGDPPDRWFLPKERGRLHLPLTAHRPVRIEVVANLTPSELSGRSYGLQDRNFAYMFPALKVITQMSGPRVSINATLLDISRRRVVWHQEDIHELDWDRLKSSLSAATSSSIDVKSLQDRQHNAAFFVNEVARRIVPSDPSAERPARVAIVLSGAMLFDTAQDLQGLELKSYSDARVLYIRFQSPPERQIVLEPRRRRGFGAYPGRVNRMPEETEPQIGNQQMDQLEPMLKALDPHLFDVVTADQARKVYAAIMTEISGL